MYKFNWDYYITFKVDNQGVLVLNGIKWVYKMVPTAGIEPATSCLPCNCSTVGAMRAVSILLAIYLVAGILALGDLNIVEFT